MLRQKLDAYRYEDEDIDEEYQRFKMEQKFEQEVGMSGKFNRGFKGVTIYDMYNDEHEDALDEHGYGLGEGVTADERSAQEVKAVQPIGPLGVPRDSVFNMPMKGRPPKKSQKYPQGAETQPSSSGLQTQGNKQAPKVAKPVQPKTNEKPAPAQQQKQKPKEKVDKEKSGDGDEPEAVNKRKDGYTGK